MLPHPPDPTPWRYRCAFHVGDSLFFLRLLFCPSSVLLALKFDLFLTFDAKQPRWPHFFLFDTLRGVFALTD
jgi:hypothetical protein